MHIQCEPAEMYSIDRYGDQGIYIQQQWYQHSLFVSAAGVVLMPAIQGLAEIQASALLSALPNVPEILIIGHDGVAMALAPEQQAHFMQARVGIECMRFEAACRTFNVLLSERRPVGALLLRGSACVY